MNLENEIMIQFDLDAGVTLESLYVKSIDFAENLRRRRNTLNIIAHDEITQDVKAHFKCIKESRDVIGNTRMTRILRHGAPALRGLDANRAADPSLEDAIHWAEVVADNIDHELSAIDRKRNLILTIASLIAASAAAIASVWPIIKSK